MNTINNNNDRVGENRIVIGKEQVPMARLLTLKTALRLELVGLTRRGRTAYSIVKSELGFKGSKQKVFAQLERYIESISPEQLELDLDG